MMVVDAAHLEDDARHRSMFPRCQTLAGDWRPARQIPLSSSTGCCDAVNFGVDTTDRDRNTVETGHNLVHHHQQSDNVIQQYTYHHRCETLHCPT